MRGLIDFERYWGMAKSPGSNRDNFSAPVRGELAKRVAFRCSLCDVQTVGPQAGTFKSHSIGIAAHIKAAAPGGPRYDEHQSPEERSSFGNGIWCCSNCAKKIDSDHGSFTVEQLLRAKTAAEERSRSRLGAPPLEGRGAPSNPSSISRAIKRYCMDEEERLEELDPRFQVSVSYGTGVEVHTLTARREAVPVRIKLSPTGSRETRDAIREVLDFGGTQVFENIAVRFEGSPLFEELGDVLQRVVISTKTQPLTVTAAFNSLYEAPLYLDFAGTGGAGTKGWRFRGTALGGVLSMELTKGCESELDGMKLGCHFELWANKPLKKLAYFDQMMRLASAFSAGTEVTLKTTADGVESEFGSGHLEAGLFLLQSREFLERVEMLRKIDSFYRLNAFMPNVLQDIFRDELDENIAFSVVNIDSDEGAVIRHGFVVREETLGLQAAIREGKPSELKLDATFNFALLGTSYGPFQVDVECESAVIETVGPVKMAPGAFVEIAMRGVGGHRWKVRLASS